MKTSLTITGDREFVAKLGKLADEMAAKKLESALVAGALVIVNRAQVLCPWITHNLQRSIHVGGYASESGGLANTTGTDIGGNKSDRSHAEVLVGTNVEYAKTVEYGHVRKAPEGYLRPAFHTTQAQVREKVVGALRQLLAGVK